MASVAQIGAVKRDGTVKLTNGKVFPWLSPNYLKRQKEIGLTDPREFVGIYRSKKEKPPELAKEK